jgi:hypothetical protein
MRKVYVYVLKRDYGFAPNPFYGYGTLATCKPGIRKHAQIGDIIIGIGSRTTLFKDKVLFAMKVTNKLSFNDYYNSDIFQCKKPIILGSRKKQYGDNIYHMENGHWIQDDSHHSFEGGKTNPINLNKDTSSDNVLISDEGSWVYYGSKAVSVPKHLNFIFEAKRKYRVYEEEYHMIEKYYQSKFTGYQGMPIEWTKEGGLIRFGGDKK